MEAPKCRTCGGKHWSRICAIGGGADPSDPSRKSRAPERPNSEADGETGHASGFGRRSSNSAEVATGLRGSKTVVPRKAERRPTEETQAGIASGPRGAPSPKKGRGGRPRLGAEASTITHQEPWRAEGISERTWWRRRKEAGN